MKLGIFDSGIGGKAIAQSLTQTFPNAEIIIVDDHENVPYGDKSPDQVITLTDIAIQPLLVNTCDIIILACNTATALAIETLRIKYPRQKFIGIEPMIKSAASRTQTNTIAICATPATLASKRYKNLVAAYGSHLTILEPDCSNWAYMIENNQINQQEITVVIDEVCAKGADVIVLGCTHYHWIKDLISKIAVKRVMILEPSEAIGERIQTLWIDKSSAA
jgi:glutamate racemase